MGIGYEHLHEITPRLICWAITGYGSEGPYRNRAGQDLVLQGYSGSMRSVGKIGDPPLPSALWAADVMSGYQAVIGVLAALYARATTGRGQYVEVDMLSAGLAAQLQGVGTHPTSRPPPTPMNKVMA